MILTDAGPLIALVDRGEPDHAACVEALSVLTAPMITTWPAFTEAMSLVGAAGAWPAQDALWKLVRRGDLQLIDMDVTLRDRSYALMAKYGDRPMDLADATLVALAESLGLRRIFTLDRDFEVYRLNGRHRFEIVPERATPKHARR